MLAISAFSTEAERLIVRHGDARTALFMTLMEFAHAVARSPQGPGHEMVMRVAELPPPEAGKRALRFIRDNEWSDEDHQQYGVYSGNLFVAQITGENMYCEGITWCWYLQDIHCQDLVQSGREESLDLAKQAVVDQFLAWLKWAQL